VNQQQQQRQLNLGIIIKPTSLFMSSCIDKLDARRDLGNERFVWTKLSGITKTTRHRRSFAVAQQQSTYDFVRNRLWLATAIPTTCQESLKAYYHQLADNPVKELRKKSSPFSIVTKEPKKVAS